MHSKSFYSAGRDVSVPEIVRPHLLQQVEIDGVMRLVPREEVEDPHEGVLASMFSLSDALKSGNIGSLKELSGVNPSNFEFADKVDSMNL